MKLRSFCLLAGLALATLASAADVGPNGEGLLNTPTTDASESEFSPLLANDFKDEASLLCFAPPAGVRLIQRASSGQEIVTFVHDAKSWGGNVQVVYVKEPGPDLSVDEFLKQSARDLARNFKGVQILDTKLISISNHKAGRQTTAMEMESKNAAGAKERVAMIHNMAAIRLEPRKYMVLNFYATVASNADAAKTFDAMLARFQILDPLVVDQRRKEASAGGRNWLKDQKAETLTAKLIDKPQFFRMKVDGRDVGFLCFTESEGDRDGYTGVLVNVASRTFPGDGSMITAKAEAFWAYRDLAYKNQPEDPRKPHPADPVFYSCWATATENLYKINTPDKPLDVRAGKTWANEMGTMALNFSAVNQGKEPLKDDQGNILKDKDGKILYHTRVGAATPDNSSVIITAVRSADSRVESALGSRSVTTVERDAEGRPIDRMHKTTSWGVEPTNPAPLPKLLEYTWGRFVDLSKPASYAFTVFNMQTRKLGLRTLTVHGKQTITVNGKTTQATRLTDELDPGSTTLWVDSTGRTLMMRTSDGTTLTPTTEPEMLAAWQATINAMNALPAPDPAQIIRDANNPLLPISPRR